MPNIVTTTELVRKMKSYTRYCRRINKLWESGKIDCCWIEHRASYWMYKIRTGEDDVYGRALLLVVRAGRGLDVVLPEELK